MRAYISKRLLLLIPTLLVVTMVSYTIMRLAPGRPLPSGQGMSLLGGDDRAAMRDEKTVDAGYELFKKQNYLDKNPVAGYFFWLRDRFFFHDPAAGWRFSFNLGKTMSYSRGEDVAGLIAQRLPITLRLNIIAILITYLIGIPLGVYSAVRKGTASDRGLTTGAFLLYSLPTFWVALILQAYLCSDKYVNIFPLQGLTPPDHIINDPDLSYAALLKETLRYYFLPVFCMTFGSFAALSRYTRTSMLEVIHMDYIRTARAKGLSEWSVIMGHALKNALIPLITLLAGLLPGLIAGSVLLEWIFGIPGMGSLSIEALSARDYNLLMALFGISAFLIMIGILCSDLMYAVVDPRISLDQKRV